MTWSACGRSPVTHSGVRLEALGELASRPQTPLIAKKTERNRHSRALSMPNKYMPIALMAVGNLIGAPALLAQDTGGDQVQSEAPRIFFDCRGPQCDNTYHRTEIPWVTWVRDQRDAELHLIMTSQSTGANGREYLLDATGREAYADYEDQSTYRSLPTDTQRERLDGVSHSLGLAFARFAEYAGFRGIVSLQASRSGTGDRALGLVSSEQVEDRWNLWVLRVIGNGNFNGEEKRVTRRFLGGLTVSRVTPTWKQSYGGFVNYNFQRTRFSDGDKFVDRRTDWNFNSTAIYSLAEFWSVGFTTRAERDTRENQELTVQFRPALEYSLFPYDEATRRSITAFYEVGPVYFNYMELTADELLEETRFRQSLTFEVSQRQTWGDVSASVEGSHYLHDFDRNNLDVGGRVSLRITRGLNLNLSGSYELVADQLYLPFEDLSDEELLTGVRRAATDKEYRFSIGFSYQFGSIFNNVVNNRFPGGGRRF